MDPGEFARRRKEIEARAQAALEKQAAHLAAVVRLREEVASYQARGDAPPAELLARGCALAFECSSWSPDLAMALLETYAQWGRDN